MHRATLLARLVLAIALLVSATAVPAQSLRGSRHSVEHSYRYARKRRLPFAHTVRDVHREVRTRALVRLGPDSRYVLHGVSYPYVTSATRTFVRSFADAYRSACGAPLVITSAMRPSRRQPANSSPRSVHPAGIAVDLRRPDGRCLRWMRRRLLALERAGRIDATEERRPAHFHVIVFATPGRPAGTR